MIEDVLAKVSAGSDSFVSEVYAEQIAGILGSWSAGLLRKPFDLTPMEQSLASDFVGFSLKRATLTNVRANKEPVVFRCQYDSVDRNSREFLFELKGDFTELARFITAEFLITRIAGSAPGRLSTRVRFELVGEGAGFHREQRVGDWELEWTAASAGQFKLSKWQALTELRSRSSNPCFTDITAAALGGNECYSSQLMHGTDYWRTVLDGASGIDIYGHNGVSVGDIDGDGFDEIYVCQPAGLPNRLFRNRGDATFEDITEISGTGVLENTACALIANINNDGQQDLIVVRTNGPLLFLNEGGTKFRQAPDAFRFANPPQGTFTGAALADYDRDGWLDIYFCLYAYYQGTDQYKYPLPYFDAQNGPPNFLMRNNRDGTFRDVTQDSGLNQNNTRYSFCCAWNDFNNDGWPDLYVVNDFGRKNLYRNNADGTFTDIAAQVGVEDVGAGMSVCWFDGDNDRRNELYVANMWTAAGERVSGFPEFQKAAAPEVRALYRKHAMGNSLFRAAEGGFRDVTAQAGVGMGRWSWSSDAWDFDHDGSCDLYVTNGMISGPSRQDLNSFFWRQVVANSPNVPKPSNDYEQGWNAINELIRTDGTWSGYERNVFYANNGDGTFSDVSGAIGLDFIEDGRAFALADFDNDGRLEIVLKNRNAPQIRILKNTMKDLPPSICFHLRGMKSNPDAIGTVLTLRTEAGQQTRTLQASSGFLSQHSKALHFGLSANQGAISALVRWPSGLVQEFFDLPSDHNVWLEEGIDKFSVKPFEKPQAHVSAIPQAVEGIPSDVQTWLLVPVDAPDFSLPDISGKVHSLHSSRDKPALLHCWSKNSDGWQRSLSALDFLSSRIHVFALNVDDPSTELRVDSRLSFPVLRCSDDVAAIYNILFRQLFDCHRDLALPTSFLLDEAGQIVKVYQGEVNAAGVENDMRSMPRIPAERISKALPFTGIVGSSEFRRNYLSYGSLFFQRGYLDPAEAAFRQALRDDPASAEALYGIGSVQLKQEKLEAARNSFELVVKLPASYPSTLPNAWNNLGLIATRQNQIAAAIPYFQQALKLSPDYQVALDNLGNAFRQQKRWDEARNVLEHAVAVNPDDPEANYSLGMVFAQLEVNDRAYDYLQRALKLRPAYPEALNNLGVLYLRTNQQDKALASFQECIRVAPDFDQSYLNLARLYALQNGPDKAKTILLELLKRRPDNVSARELLRQLP